jgi:hypothetical protein
MPYPIVSGEYLIVPIESCRGDTARVLRVRPAFAPACTLNHAPLRDTANSVPPRSGIALK